MLQAAAEDCLLNIPSEFLPYSTCIEDNVISPGAENGALNPLAIEATRETISVMKGVIGTEDDVSDGLKRLYVGEMVQTAISSTAFEAQYLLRSR